MAMSVVNPGAPARPDTSISPVIEKEFKRIAAEKMYIVNDPPFYRMNLESDG
jgi:hypothetical protein